jgi:hypothetical protein
VVIVLAKESAEVHHHALQTMTEQLKLCELSPWKATLLLGK